MNQKKRIVLGMLSILLLFSVFSGINMAPKAAKQEDNYYVRIVAIPADKESAFVDYLTAFLIGKGHAENISSYVAATVPETVKNGEESFFTCASEEEATTVFNDLKKMGVEAKIVLNHMLLLIDTNLAGESVSSVFTRGFGVIPQHTTSAGYRVTEVSSGKEINGYEQFVFGKDYKLTIFVKADAGYCFSNNKTLMSGVDVYGTNAAINDDDTYMYQEYYRIDFNFTCGGLFEAVEIRDLDGLKAGDSLYGQSISDMSIGVVPRGTAFAEDYEMYEYDGMLKTDDEFSFTYEAVNKDGRLISDRSETAKAGKTYVRVIFFKLMVNEKLNCYAYVNYRSADVEIYTDDNGDKYALVFVPSYVSKDEKAVYLDFAMPTGGKPITGATCSNKDLVVGTQIRYLKGGTMYMWASDEVAKMIAGKSATQEDLKKEISSMPGFAWTDKYVTGYQYEVIFRIAKKSGSYEGIPKIYVNGKLFDITEDDIDYSTLKDSRVVIICATDGYIAPAKTTISKIENTASSVKLTWKKITGAEKYLVYRSVNGGKYTKIATTTGTSYTDKTAKTNGNKYAYKIKTYCLSKVEYAPMSVSSYGAVKNALLTGKAEITEFRQMRIAEDVYGEYSAVATTYFLSKPQIKTISSPKKADLKITYSKNGKGNGYEISYSTSSKFKNAKKITVTKKSTVAKTISKLRSGKKYFVKVRAYKKVGTKKYYSVWSAVKAKTVK